MLNRIKFILALLYIASFVHAQNSDTAKLSIIDYSEPKEYIIQDVKITGIQFLDTKILLSMSGLTVGRKITLPGEVISKVIDKFWDQGLFSDVKINATKIEGDKIWLEIQFKERPRLTKLIIKGVKKSEMDDLNDMYKIKPGNQVTDNVINTLVNLTKQHFREKGFFNTKVLVSQTPDSVSKNRVYLTLTIDKRKKVRIKSIQFEGNSKFSQARLRRVLKKTKQISWNFIKPSKYIEKDYKEDKDKLKDFYSKNGYRDFSILSDSISFISESRINLKIKIHEGNQYHFRNITWIGNTKYPSEYLDKVLILKKGDVYDQVTFEKRLNSDEDAVHNLYYDNGYLFSSLNPVESRIENDSVDLDIYVTEGRQATINKIIITGNTKTNENVVRRELYTRPGDLFSRTNIVSSVRRLAALGNFDPEKISPEPLPNQSDGTVDIEYKLVEKANDQLELSGGWGYNSLIGSVGIKFNNFSTAGLFKGKEWRPVPTGDGQSVAIRIQSNGTWMRTMSFSFVDPWFGGKKPNSFSFGISNQVYDQTHGVSTLLSSNNAGKFKMTSVSVGLGRRLQWPDDNFQLSNSLSYQHYLLDNYNNAWFTFSNGNSNTIAFGTVFSRQTTDQPIYPRSGSMFSLGLQITPPFSLFRNQNFWVLTPTQSVNLTPQEIFNTEQANKYQFIEYHKWSYRGVWVNELAKDLVLYFNSQFGYLGYFSRNLGYSPFEGFVLGGSGMSWNALGGREIIGLRGYADQSVTPQMPVKYYSNNIESTRTSSSANLYEKLTIELRYPISLQPSATIYAETFLEAGNSWYRYEDFNPFSLKRSAGLGIRAFLPMVGAIGIDWGYGFDPIPNNPSANKGQFHFTMGQTF